MMPSSHWPEVSLSEVAICQGGCAFPPALQGRRTGATAFFKVSDMNLPANRWVMRRANNYISVDDEKGINGGKKPAGSVIFPKVGATIFTNKKRLLSKPAFVDNNLMAVWSKDATRCLPEFLYLHFLTISLSELANPGPLPSINSSRIYEQTIHLPPIEDQKRISTIMFHVRKAVALQEQFIECACDLKQSALTELFSRGLRNRSQVESEYGPIPESWAIAPLNEIAEIQTGVAKGRKLAVAEVIEVPYLRVANVQDGHLDLQEIKTIRIRRSELERYRLRAGDVLLTEGGDFDKLGRGFIWRGELDLCVHQNHVFAVRPDRRRLLPDFFAYLAQSPYGKAYFLQVAHKTTNLACINAAKLKAFPVLVPPLDDQTDIVSILEAIDAKVGLHERKRAVLENLFQVLLRKLTAGAVDVSAMDLSGLGSPALLGAA